MHRFGLILVSALAICACSNESIANDKGKVKRVSCESELPFTEQRIGNITIKLFEPNDPSHPDIWQGPICFTVNGAECGLDISLIKGVEPGGNSHVVVNAFSGSVAHIYTVDPASCSIVDHKAR
jgi:hypothetical protein